MNVANEVTYISTDEQRQVIPWIRVKDRQGNVTEYYDRIVLSRRTKLRMQASAEWTALIATIDRRTGICLPIRQWINRLQQASLILHCHT